MSWRSWISASFTSAAPRSRLMITTCLVTSGVTLGLPSRSPPIHEAKRTGTTLPSRFHPQYFVTRTGVT
jgi:hypothetical protein